MSIFVSYIPHGEGTSTRTGIDCQKLSEFTCGKRAARLAGEDPERRIGRLPYPPIAAPGSFASDAAPVTATAVRRGQSVYFPSRVLPQAMMSSMFSRVTVNLATNAGISVRRGTPGTSTKTGCGARR